MHGNSVSESSTYCVIPSRILRNGNKSGCGNGRHHFGIVLTNSKRLRPICPHRPSKCSPGCEHNRQLDGQRRRRLVGESTTLGGGSTSLRGSTEAVRRRCDPKQRSNPGQTNGRRRRSTDAGARLRRQTVRVGGTQLQRLPEEETDPGPSPPPTPRADQRRPVGNFLDG